MGVSGSDAPVLDGFTTFIFFNDSLIEEHIQDFCSAWFIVSGQSWVELQLGSILVTAGCRGYQSVLNLFPVTGVH
jgi:hypothetical protein